MQYSGVLQNVRWLRDDVDKLTDYWLFEKAERSMATWQDNHVGSSAI